MTDTIEGFYPIQYASDSLSCIGQLSELNVDAVTNPESKPAAAYSSSCVASAR